MSNYKHDHNWSVLYGLFGPYTEWCGGHYHPCLVGRCSSIAIGTSEHCDPDDEHIIMEKSQIAGRIPLRGVDPG